MSEKADHLFDKRTVERNLNNGRINRREFESYMGHLPDAKDKSQPLFAEESDEAAAEVKKE